MSDSLKRKKIVFLLIICLVPVSVSGYDKKIGINYFVQAELLYKAGNYNEAEKLLTLGYEFYPDFSEITYLLSVIQLGNQSTTLSGLSWLKKAITDNSWTKTDPFTAQRELGRVYLRIREQKKAIEVFLNMEQRLKEDPESAYLMARALKETGDTKKLESFLADAQRRFPAYFRLSILYAEFLRASGRTKKALQVIDQGLEKSPDNTDLLLEKIKLTDDPGEKEKLLTGYFAGEGNSPEACLAALGSGATGTDTYTAMFFTHGGNSDILLLDRFIALSAENEGLVPALDEHVSGFSGSRIIDENDDGFYEEYYVYENGVLVRWFSDRNQDGMPETEILFNNEIPHAVVFYVSDNASTTAVYSTYPNIESVAFDSVSADKSRTGKIYSLLPLVYSFELFKKSGEKDAGKKQLGVPSSYRPPREKDILKTAYRLTESENGKEIKTAELSGGETVSVSYDTDMDGVRDHIVVYKNRMRVSGRRDMDNDGIFELLEYYKNNVLEKITFDYNNDGKPDCTQYFSASGDITGTDWDYDFNGTIDAREIPGKNNRLEMLFSTKYNGVFDLRFLFVAGRMTEATRGGQTVKIIPGTSGIYWIGKKGIEFTVEPSMRNGVYTQKGKSYFIFRYREDIYIEELL